MQDPGNDIKEVVRMLLSGSVRERQKVIDTCFTPNVVFVHPLLTLAGRRELFDLYQYWHDINYRITFELPKIVVSQRKDRLILDFNQFVTPLTMPWWTPVIRLIVILDLQNTPNGYKISKQEDHVLWEESLIQNLPWMDRLWNTLGRRTVGLSICYTMRGLGKSVRFLSQHAAPYIPLVGKCNTVQSKLQNVNRGLDFKLLQKWETESPKAGT